MKTLKRFKSWFLNRFLPMWAKETVLRDNRNLQKEVAALQEELARKTAFIDGMVAGIKWQRRIVINTMEGKK